MLATLILHERIARWARRLRPLAHVWGFRLVETRSADALLDAARGSACPVVGVEVGSRLERTLLMIESARSLRPSALILALAEDPRPEIVSLLLEAGATSALGTREPVPRILETFERWVGLARERVAASGWACDRRREPEPWEAFLPEAFAPLAPHAPPDKEPVPHVR